MLYNSLDIAILYCGLNTLGNCVKNYYFVGSLYAWVVVFVLPVNSALNPLLYTFTTPKYCKIIKGLSCVSVKKNRQYNRKKQFSAGKYS